MGQNRFWIGGYTNIYAPLPMPWLVAVTDDGAPYLCCKCPCVDYYAVFAFRTIELTGTNHSEYNWCSQFANYGIMGVDKNHQVHLDYIIAMVGVGATSASITIDPNAATYAECGRTTIEVESPTFQSQWYEVRAYRISDKYECYDEFRDECFSHCTNLPCDEYDQTTGECTHHYLPTYAKVFNGQYRPCYGQTSYEMSQYSCLGYWSDIAWYRYIPRFDVEFATMQMNCSFNRDAYDCLESHTERICINYDEQGNCIEWNEWEMCDRMGLYAASATIDGSTTYHTLIWDGTGQMPDRTTTANVNWLSSAISSILPMISAAKATAPSTWSTTSTPYQYTGQICKDWDASSNQYCNYYYSETTGKTWYWQCVRATLSKPSNAPQDATGIKVRVREVVRDYDGTEDPTTLLPSYTETEYVSERDIQWGVAEYFRVADGLTVSASAVACGSGDHSNACVTPCDVDGHGFPHQQVHVYLQAMDYLYGNPSDWSSSSSSSSSGSSN